MKEGVLVGADASQEWLLSWWWENYQRYNQYPVTFADFGMSEDKKNWCQDRGTLLPIKAPPLFVKDQNEVEPSLKDAWEGKFADRFWALREAWFKKPLACLHSPYDTTLWLDLDCEVAGPLKALFNVPFQKEGIALAKDFVHTEVYNSGVILFRKDHLLIKNWAKEAIEKNGSFRGDQDLLTHIIIERKIPIFVLEPIYNWGIGYGKEPNVLIYHWAGELAKGVLQNKLILDALL